MNKQCLQHILFPKVEICTEMGLYFRNNDKEKNETDKYIFDGNIQLDKEDMLDFGTYFNSFSYGIWRRYSDIDNINLKLEVKGKFKIHIYQMELINNVVMKRTLKRCIIDCMEKSKLELEICAFDDRGQIAFELKALDSNSIFYGGEYFTKNEQKIDLPRIGVDICTYHREEYVYRNFFNIKKYIDCNPENILEKQVDFYIVDNGESLDKSRIEISNVEIIEQPDCGSTGGFTRGIIEIVNNKEKKYDRILLMDDDILFEPEVIERICFFVAFLKREYKNNFIGGGNLDLNTPWMQHESGGFFDEFKYTICGEFYDLNEPYCLLKNEYDRNATSSAWWCCCIPSNYVGENNLPYPFFFHREDMEYSYRNKKSVILLNGIGVWHESFFNKQPSWHVYYDVRNQLILDSLHFSKFNKKKAKKILLRNMVTSLVRYRYKECEFLIQAYKDYLKGPEWLRKYDNAEYLEEKILNNYEIKEINEALDYKIYEERLNFVETSFRKKIRILTINGYLLPANKNVVAPMSNYNSSVSFRAKRIINYDFIRQRGYITERSYKEALKYIFKMLEMFVELDFKFKKLKNMYKNDFSTAIELKTWKRKLNLN